MLGEEEMDQSNRRHTYKVRTRCHPCRAAEDRARHHGNKGNLRAAGDKGGRHDRHAAVALVFNGSRCHDARNAAAGSDEHRNKGLADGWQRVRTL